jgi:hypothetical protein
MLNPSDIGETSILGRLAAGGVVAAVLLLHAAVPAPARAALVPAITVDPPSGAAGVTVTVTGSGFTDGQGSILFDDIPVDVITITAGAFTRALIIPPSAAPGAHTITACWGSPCVGGEFEQKASTTFTAVAPSTSPPATGAPEYELLALEVTQGVRGALPAIAITRVLAADNFGPHVANRRTVVRAYVRANPGTGGEIRPVTATLEVETSDGFREVVRPATTFIRPGRLPLDTMRGNAAHSFNFVLPPRYTQAGEVTIRVGVNPIGPDHAPECREGCRINNSLALPGVRFAAFQTPQPYERVLIHDHNGDIRVLIYIADVAWREGGDRVCDLNGNVIGGTTDGEIVTFMPTHRETSESVTWWMKTWPVDPSKLRITYRYTKLSTLPPGASSDARFACPRIPDYPPWDNDNYKHPDFLGRSTYLRQPYSYIWLAFDDESWMGCGGNAGIGFTPLFHAGTCGPTVAQEAAHSLSLDHAQNAHGELAGGGFDPSYPGLHGEVEAGTYGFDTWELRAVPPNLEGHTHDFMSYGPNQWVSLYTWQNLSRLFGTTVTAGLAARRTEHGTATARVDSEHLRIAGQITAAGEVYLNSIFSQIAAEDAADGTGSYQLTLRDSAGAVVTQRAFEPYEISEPGMMEFDELVPVAGELAGLEISKAGQVVARRAVSAGRPTVEVTSPAVGAHWAASGDITVRWSASDPDGDPLTYRVQLSQDGQTWETIYGPTNLTEAPIHLPYVPGSGSGWRVRVQASDGINVGAGEVGGLTIAPKPPIPTILGLSGNTFVGVGGSVEAFGQGYDFQDGDLPASALQWLLDGRPVGTGESVRTGALGAGDHTLTLRATNSAGVAGTAEVTVTVGLDADGDRLPDDWEATAGLDPSNVEDAAADADGDGRPNWLEYDLGSDPADPDDQADRSPHGVDVGVSGERLGIPSAPGGSIPVAIVVVAAVLVVAAGGLLWHGLRRTRRRSDRAAAVGPAGGSGPEPPAKA